MSALNKVYPVPKPPKRKSKKPTQYQKAKNRLAAAKRDGYHCTRYGRWTWLSSHHKDHMGRGGEESVENRETLCIVCHGADHGIKVFLSE